MMKHDRYGRMTITREPVSQAPTLQSRMRDAFARQGVSNGHLEMQACDLVRKHPMLTAAQACEVILDRLNGK